jgi:hypothetical protein
MAKRIAHAKELLASYEKDRGKIDWSKLKIQCSTNIKFSCENAQAAAAAEEDQRHHRA